MLTLNQGIKFLIVLCIPFISACKNGGHNKIEPINLRFSYTGFYKGDNLNENLWDYHGQQVFLLNVRTLSTDTLTVDDIGMIKIANIHDGPYLLIYENVFEEPMYRILEAGKVSDNDTISLQDNIIFRARNDLWVDAMADGDTIAFFAKDFHSFKISERKKIYLVKSKGLYFARSPFFVDPKGKEYGWVKIGDRLDWFVRYEAEFRKAMRYDQSLCSHPNTFYIAKTKDTLQFDGCFKWTGLNDLYWKFDSLDFEEAGHQ